MYVCHFFTNQLQIGKGESLYMCVCNYLLFLLLHGAFTESIWIEIETDYTLVIGYFLSRINRYVYIWL